MAFPEVDIIEAVTDEPEIIGNTEEITEEPTDEPPPEKSPPFLKVIK